MKELYDARRGDVDAMEAIIQKNEGLVRSLANRAFKVLRCNNVNQGGIFDDVLNEGRHGIILAVKKFDPRLGAWGTYAYQWIRREIWRFILSFCYGENIRIPASALAIHSKALNLEKDSEGNKLEGTALQKAELSGDYTTKELKTIGIVQTAVKHHFRIDINRREGREAEGPGIIDHKAVDPSEEIEADDSKDVIREQIEILQKHSPRLAYVLTSFYGIDCEKKTLQDMANEFNLSKERVRKFKEKSLQIIRERLMRE